MDGTNKRGLLGSGIRMVMRNKRYILWFWLLDLALSWLGTISLRENAHVMLDHSLYSNQLVHGFHLWVLIEFFARPESGALVAMTVPAICLAAVFFFATALFLPGVFAGYSSTYRLPREDFFRACGRNLWRFIRLLIMAGIVMGVFAGLLFAANGAIVKKAGENTNELLPFEMQVAGLTVIFLIMTTLRIWFDLAEADIVLNDRRAVRKSVAAGFRHTFRNLGNLLGAYVLITVVAAIVLVGGLWIWEHFVAPDSVKGALFVSQFILFLLLIPRFWQRGVAVTYWQWNMLAPVAVAVPPILPEPVLASPQPAPAVPAPGL